MNRTRLLSALAALLAAQFACLYAGQTPNAPIPITGKTPDNASVSTAKPIGSIRQLKGGVRAGPESALEDVSPSRDMYDNEAAQVYNQGKARLDYGYGITFTLYNDTATGGTSISASGQVKAKLAQGGLLGHNPPGTRTEVQLANNGSVVILGTTYFILYDAGRGVAWVYNFDGTVRYSIGGGPLQELPAGTLVAFDRTQVVEALPDLRFTPEEFDRYATDQDSPLGGMRALLNDRRAAEPPPPPPPPDGLKAAVIQFADCRYGPGADYLEKTVFKGGERMQVIGRVAGGRWLQVQAGDGPCWINAELVKLEGDVMRLPDAYPFPTGLPVSPLSGKIIIVETQRKGEAILVRWEGYDIPGDLRQEGLVQYIVEVWTCVGKQPGFYALGTDGTSMQFQVDESCGVPWHADVIGQDRQGFSPPADIFAP